MRYSKERIDFFSGEFETGYDFVPIDDSDEHQLIIDMTRHYENGERRIFRYMPLGFIEDLYYFKRHLMSKEKNSYKSYQIAIDTKYEILSEIRDFEKHISTTKIKIKKDDYVLIKEELNVVIDAYKINYENIWWRIKLPIIISILAISMSAVSFWKAVLQPVIEKIKIEKAVTKP